MTSPLRRLVPIVLLLVAPAIARADDPPAAPVAIPSSELSLDDLGISATLMQADPHLQAQLERRTWMLKTHQILGLVTAIPMILSVATGPGDGEGRQDRRTGEIEGPPSRASVNRHAALGISTTVLYLTTASFALLAPNPEHPAPRGVSRIHRWLAWIHAPLMIAVPVLGEMADARLKKGQPGGSIGNLHRVAVGGLLVSYGAAATIMTINF